VRAARHRRQVELGIVERGWPLPPREKAVPAWTDMPEREWQAERMAAYAAQIDHEGGIATPLIAWGPVVAPRGGFTAQPGHVIDIMATCLDVGGAEYPKVHDGQEIIPLEGRSLLPILQGAQRPGHETLFWEHEGNRAVRQGRWKLVFAHSRPARANSMHANLSVGEPGAGAWELYDLEQDRTETRNLASAHPALVRELAAQYDAWAARVGATLR
jgi:arylsulfatase